MVPLWPRETLKVGFFFPDGVLVVVSIWGFLWPITGFSWKRFRVLFTSLWSFLCCILKSIPTLFAEDFSF